MFLFLSLLLSQLHFWLSFLFVLKNHTYITTQFLASTPKLWDEWCWSNLAVSHKPTISGFCSSQNHTSCSEGVKLAANFVSSHSWRWYTQCSPPFPTFVRLCCRLGVPANALTPQPAFLPSIERRGLPPPDRVLRLTNLHPAQSEEEKIKKSLFLLLGDTWRRTTDSVAAFRRTDSVSPCPFELQCMSFTRSG